MDLGLELVPFTDVEANGFLASRLALLVGTVDHRLEREMPQVLPRYANPRTALESLRSVQVNMRRNKGFVAYLVKHEGLVVGVVSCDQRRLTGPRRLKGLWPGKQLACGPLVAGWLGDLPHRPTLMARVLAELATKIKSNSFMVGHPWTLVRVGHKYVEEQLLDHDNGFGGFEPREVDEFTKVDGLQRMRRLYVACNDLT